MEQVIHLIEGPQDAATYQPHTDLLAPVGSSEASVNWTYERSESTCQECNDAHDERAWDEYNEQSFHDFHSF